MELNRSFNESYHQGFNFHADLWPTKRADPLITELPFTSDHSVWLIPIFWLAVLTLRKSFGENSKRANGVQPLIFLWYTFLLGLSLAATAIGFIVINYGEPFWSCDVFPMWSEMGFRGKIKIYMSYFAFLGKVYQTTEAIWYKSLSSCLILIFESTLTGISIRFDGNDHVWLDCGLHIPIVIWSYFYKALEATGETNRKSVIVQRKRSIINLFIAAKCAVLLIHGLYVFAVPVCGFPKHFAAMEIIYPFFVWNIYPNLYVD